jgi:hypothetical protein
MSHSWFTWTSSDLPGIQWQALSLQPITQESLDITESSQKVQEFKKLNYTARLKKKKKTQNLWNSPDSQMDKLKPSNDLSCLKFKYL